jgi:hypothetical protein
MSLSFAVSYSYITQAKINKNTVKAVTANMTYTFNFTASSSTQFGTYRDMTKYAYFTFSRPSGYATHVYILASHSTNSGSSTIQSTYVPMEDLWIQIYSANSSGVPVTAITEPTRIADNIVLTPSSANYMNTYYIIHQGILNTTSTQRMAAVIWCDPSTAAANNGKTIDVALIIYEYPVYHSTYHNLGGTVLDSSGNPVSGAKVIFQNKMAYTTNSSGGYTITNVPIGTWKLDVDNGGELYSTTIRVAGGTNAISQAGNYSYTASSTYVQKAAYARYTTVYKIMQRNSLTNSNYIPSVAYTTPYYNYIRLEDSLSNKILTNINTTLNADHTITMSLAS